MTPTCNFLRTSLTVRETFTFCVQVPRRSMVGQERRRWSYQSRFGTEQETSIQSHRGSVDDTDITEFEF